MTRMPRSRALARRMLGRSSTGPTDERCRVCRSRNLRARHLNFVRDPRKECDIRRCLDCGYVAILRTDESIWKEKTSLDHSSGRVGTAERVGREFHMGKLAADILGRDGLSVLVYGAGGNMDNLHIEQLDQVKRVAIGDIMKLRDDAEFIDLTRPARERFDIVVASEVVEHFRDPRADFERLFGYVADDGLIIASTNIHAGNDLARDGYIFYPDHTSYYSPRSLRMLANDAGYHLDFRTPLLGPRMRKRYIFFARSQDLLEDVACYFGTEVYAPSESPQPMRPPPQRSHAAWRTDTEDA
jgi:SAM-dependent methyltransferase